MTPVIFLVAGEPSGDRLGAALMAGITNLADQASFVGVGGPAMESCGLESIFDYTELSVMGIAEVIPRLPRLMHLVNKTTNAALSGGVDALVTIDSPDFCLRVARRAKAGGAGFPVIHYVAPSLWAWRPGRARSLSRSVDHILSLLPFEPGFLQERGISSTFVGHPVVADPLAEPDCVAGMRNELEFKEGRPILAVLPGSRESEISVLEPVFRQAVGLFLQQHPEYSVVIPAAPTVADLLASRLDGWPQGTQMLDPNIHPQRIAEARKRAVLQMADIALAASGTVVLELARAATPMVAAYDMNWFSRQLVGSLLRVDTVNLVNLVLGNKVVPELLGRRCRPELICKKLVELSARESARQSQLASFEIVLEQLGKDQADPGLRAAQTVIDVIQQSLPVRPRTG